MLPYLVILILVWHRWNEKRIVDLRWSNIDGMNVRFLVFISLVAAALGLAAFYVGTRVLTWSEWAATHGAAVWLTLAICIVLQFLGPILYRALPRHKNKLFFLHWLTYTALGVFACMFFYVLVADVLVGLVALVFPFDGVAHAQLAIVCAMVSITLVVGSLQVAFGPRVYRIDIPLPNLPHAFNGFRIVQLSDLHLGPMIGARYAERCVRVANQLDADVVALTGDFVDGAVAHLKQAAAPLAGLRAKQGVFFITGNHEYYSGVLEWIDEFKRLGTDVLLNRHVVLRRGDGEIVLAGVTDYSAGRMVPAHASDPARAIHGAPPGAVKILLAHHPKSYAAAAQAGFDLQLSGHTHGGQFFPFSVVVRIAERYYKGLYKIGALWLYVSRGTGYWGPPLRFGVPPEIGVITLRRA